MVPLVRPWVAQALAVALAASARAQAPAPRWEAGARFENDYFAGTDRWYTSGQSVSLARVGAGRLAPLADRLPWGGGRRSVSWDLGQALFTPDDLSRAVPDPADRPYAAILFAAVSLHVDSPRRYDGLKLVGGVLGPAALGAQTQRAVHRNVAGAYPAGWGHQLRDEPVLNLVWEERRRLPLVGPRGGLSAEALPSASAMAGNILAQAGLGAQLRLGWRVPADFGGTLMRGMVQLAPPRRAAAGWGLWVFAGGEADLVGRNATLDGNAFARGPRVGHRPFLPGWEAGVGAGGGRAQVTFTRVQWGREFDAQKAPSRFGAVDAAVLF